jgi:hypothetical protein
VKAEEAFDFLVHHLSSLSFRKDIYGRRQGNRGVDLYIPDIARNYWEPRLSSEGRFIAGVDIIPQEKVVPFYDAAWELCRLGVLRPGQFAPMGQGHPSMFGDHYVITTFGAQWLKEASQRAFLDMSRLASMLAGFARRFGDGYAQRATEAVKTYRTGNWLAACVMAGAAAESILISIAVAKSGDEKKTLATYNAASGRANITKLVAKGVRASIQQHFENALLVLHYWRDTASHGVATSLGEIEAHVSLSQLLRLAQFADKYWNQLIKKPAP